MSAPRAMVTGAAGFIGAALAHRLVRDGLAVTLVVADGSDLWRVEELQDDAAIEYVDLRDAEEVQALVRRCRPELIFHLAAHGAYSWQRSLPRMLDTNVGGFVNLAEAAVGADVQALVSAGSSSEYGLKDHAPEEHELPEPNSAYAFTKASATLFGGWIARARGAAITTLRLYSAYGPWEDPRRLVPTLLTDGLDGRLPPLADPRIGRDFVHVDDVVEAFVLAAGAAQPGEGAVYNIGSGVQTTLRELVDVARGLLELTDEPTWGSFPDRAWDTDVWVADARQARADLGWAPALSLSDGLLQTIEWLRSRPALQGRYARRKRRAADDRDARRTAPAAQGG